MTDQFPAFAHIVATSFQKLVKTPNVFVTLSDTDALYRLYLESFPEGTNPKFKERTEHDCSCCKQFIRRAGNIVTVDERGELCTVWDDAAKSAPAPYDHVARIMRTAVVAAPISDLYRVSKKEGSFGARQSHSQDKMTGRALTWNHFHTGPIPKHLQADSPDETRGTYRTTVQVFTRGLTELKPEALDTVLSLIEANNLYRGEEYKGLVVEFRNRQRHFFKWPEGDARNTFAWVNANDGVARFRNTVIGTLVQDLSEGVDLEQAVKSFEQKVAPTNYKRTSAVITPMMVKKAMQTIAELDLEPALERRLATISDISVKDVLWVDGQAKPLMKGGGLASVLMDHAEASNPKDTKADEERAEKIEIDAFVKDVLPTATGMQLLFKGQHLGNLMSLTAPVHPEPKQLFRWDNDFAWAYAGNVTDSIKERVKAAGGKVEGTLRVSLSWFNFDDLDLHVYEPQQTSGYRGLDSAHIFFRAKRGWTGGVLDVDMNAGSGTTREAVENVIWTNKVPDGLYRVVVHNYALRERSDVGFTVQVECNGQISNYSYSKLVQNNHAIGVVGLHMKNGTIERVEIPDENVTTTSISTTKWGLTTEQYVKVNAVTLSPNYWGENKSGNKHTFFVLDGAKCDEPMRGIFNEYLHPRLTEHRKVFEVVGDKTKCQPTEGALSGVGFSSTKKDSFVVKVQQGKKQRLFNVQVGNAQASTDDRAELGGVA